MVCLLSCNFFCKKDNFFWVEGFSHFRYMSKWKRRAFILLSSLISFRYWQCFCHNMFSGDCLPDLWRQRHFRSYSYLCQVSWCWGTPVLPPFHYIIYIQLFMLCVYDVKLLQISLCYGGLKMKRNIYGE